MLSFTEPPYRLTTPLPDVLARVPKLRAKVEVLSEGVTPLGEKADDGSKPPRHRAVPPDANHPTRSKSYLATEHPRTDLRLGIPTVMQIYELQIPTD